MTAQGVPPIGKTGQRTTPTSTLAERLGSQDNALNLVRLVLASLVIFGHAFPLGGFPGIHWGPFTHSGLHGQAVNGFFVISGYLIFASGLRTSTLGYLWRRFLRIYPGYIVAVLLTVFLAAPLGALLETDAHWEWRSAVQYVVGALDLKPSQEGVEATLLHTPWAETWNGSLWTLFYEACAYIGVAALCATTFVRNRLPFIVPVATASLTFAHIVVPAGALQAMLPGAAGTIADQGLRLWTYFAWGMTAHLFAHRIRVTPTAGIAAGVAFILATHLSLLPYWASTAITVPALSITVLAAGALLPWRVGATNDISYGVYVYAFPVQQLLVLTGIHHLGWLLTSLACLALTVPLAWLSWKLVEQPAMRLKNRVPARTSRSASSSRHA